MAGRDDRFPVAGMEGTVLALLGRVSGELPSLGSIVRSPGGDLESTDSHPVHLGLLV